MTMINNILFLVAGIIIGQECGDNIPRLRPHVEAGIAQVIAWGKKVSEEAEKKQKEPKEDTVPPFFRRWSQNSKSQ